MLSTVVPQRGLSDRVKSYRALMVYIGIKVIIGDEDCDAFGGRMLRPQ